MSELIQAGQHLDADTLNAFVEQALPEHERLVCLAHLGECARCREIAFAAGGADEVEVVPVGAPERAWWQWGAMAWGGAAAGLACVLVAVTMLHGRHAGVDRVARVEAPVTEAFGLKALAAAPPAAPDAKAKAAAPNLAKALRYAKPTPPKAVFEEPEEAVANGVLQAPLLSRDKVVTMHGSATAGGVLAGSAVADVALQAQVSRLATAPAPVATAAAPKALPMYSRVVGKASAMPQTVTVEANSVAQIVVTKPTPVAEGLAMRAMKKAPAPIVLPNRLAVAGSAEWGGRVVAVDTAGGVFLRVDGDAGWTRIRPVWTGKAVGVEAGGTGFRLKVEDGTVWVSGDGVEWAKE